MVPAAQVTALLRYSICRRPVEYVFYDGLLKPRVCNNVAMGLQGRALSVLHQKDAGA